MLFIDAIHDIDTQYNALSLSWIPTQLKENVKVILSVCPEINGLLDKLKLEIIPDDTHYLEVADLQTDDCLLLISELLEREHKTVSPEQKNVLRQTFNICANPLYLKVVIQFVRTWTSYDNVDNSVMALDIQQAIIKFLDHIEVNRGHHLVSHALAYLTASKTGLSDNEMEDVLSIDDTVMNEIFPDWEPARVRRCPSLAWARLKYDLRDFLVLKDCEGVTLYSWSHTQFATVCQARYLDDDRFSKEIHSTLADYFLGVWSGKKKPYIKPYIQNNNNVQELTADRLVPSQPLTFYGDDGEIHFNKRKYGQVPVHLFSSGRLKEFNELVLFSYEWLYNKTKALSLDLVLADFAMNPGVEAILVEKALRDSRAFITLDTDCLAPELTGRLLSYYTSHPNIQKLLSECDTMGLKQCSFIPNFPYHQIPGSPLKTTFKYQGMPSCFAMTGENTHYLLAKDPHKATVCKYDLISGEHTADICTSMGEMLVPPGGQYLVIVDNETEKAIKIHTMEDGSFVGQLIPLNHIQLKPKEKYHLDKVSLSDSHLCIIVTTDKSYLCIADLQKCRFLDMRGLEGKATICEITPDFKYVFCNSNETLVSYDLNTLEQFCNTTLEYRPSQVIFKKDVMRGFLINDVENKIYVMHLREGNLELIYKIVLTEYFQEDSMQNLTLSSNQELLLVRGKQNLLIYHVSTERVICHISRPADIPTEFKLPRSNYEEIDFTQAVFSADNKFVIGSIFRNIYVWHSANGRQLTSLQAPVGVIDHLLIPSDRGQIVTHLANSNEIHVWGLGDAIGHTGHLDRLTRPVEEILVTADDAKAFVKCQGSDEVGVLDMKTGQLVDLFTHPTEVVSFSATPDGKYLFVATKPGKPNTANKIWYLDQRQIIYEYGKGPAYNVAMKNDNTIISVIQQSSVFNAPYHITLFSFNTGLLEEYNLMHEIKFVLSKPFIMPQDKYLVILTADEYQQHKAHYVNPTICAIALKSNMAMSTFSANELQDVVRIRRILHIRPMPRNSYTIVVFYTNEPDITSGRKREQGYDHCHGFLIFDICSGVVCQVIDDFLAPSTPMDHVIFAKDVSLCLDDQSNIFDMGTGYYVKRLHNKDVRPQRLALNSKVAVYFNRSFIYAIRINDGVQIGSVDVHGTITCLEVCHDERTVVAGCKDGALVSYVIIDDQLDDVNTVLPKVGSRQSELLQQKDSSLARSWDKVDSTSLPAYSRPPSTINIGPSDREMLQKVKPVPRIRPTSDTILYLNPKSQVCNVM